MLAQAFAGLSLGAGRPQTLGWSRHGVCGATRLDAAHPQQAASSVSCEVVCGKVKTRKAVAKRFKVSGGGKIMRRSPGKQHINEKMSSNTLRKLGKMSVVTERDLPNIAPNLPYSGVKQSRN